MVAANGVSAGISRPRGFPSIRRVVRSPERWARIVDLASEHGGKLPAEPDAPALAAVPRSPQRAAAPDTFPDLSLSVIKLLGRGEYVVGSARRRAAGHFALAVDDYTHSTAPNRRFPDLVTQRLLKAAIARHEPALHAFASWRRWRSTARVRRMRPTRSSA